MLKPYDYSMITDFMGKFLPQGFAHINRQDPWMVELERKLKHNRQFFYIADLALMKVLFTSRGSLNIIGVEPERLDLSTLLTAIHPADFHRHSLARSMVVKRGYDLLMRRRGVSIHSAHSHVKHTAGNFINLFFQVYSFYTEIPHKTVFTLVLLTDLSSFTLGLHGYHYYIRNDPAIFRYPDKELLSLGHDFSDREFEIIQQIAAGLGSKQIADKLFLSVNTVNTHRRNILKKTNHATLHDLVRELQGEGMI